MDKTRVEKFRLFIANVILDCVKLQKEVDDQVNAVNVSHSKEVESFQNALDVKYSHLVATLPETFYATLNGFNARLDADALGTYSDAVLYWYTSHVRKRLPAALKDEMRWHELNSMQKATPYDANDPSAFLRYLFSQLKHLEQRVDIACTRQGDTQLSPAATARGLSEESTLTSTTEEGEIKETTFERTIATDRLKQKEFLAQLWKFKEGHRQYRIQKAELAKQIQEASTLPSLRQRYPTSLMKHLTSQEGLEVVCTVFEEEIIPILGRAREESLTKSIAYKADMYAEVWCRLRPIYAILDSIPM